MTLATSTRMPNPMAIRPPNITGWETVNASSLPLPARDGPSSAERITA